MTARGGAGRGLPRACVAVLAAVSMCQCVRVAEARIVVVGDIHGDTHTARAILESAGVMDAAGRWAAHEPTTVVQLGDVTDRGPDPHGVMDMFMRLKEDAAPHGGDVVMLLGNHDIMMLQHDWRHVHPWDIDAFGGVEARLQAYSPHGRYGAYLRSHSLVHAIGSTVFCHAGPLARFAKQGLEALNVEANLSLHPAPGSLPRFNDDLWGNDMMNANSDGGPVWTRKVLSAAKRGDCRVLDRALAELSKREGRGFDRMVVGHTAQSNGTMQFLCGGRFVAADVGTSRYLTEGMGGYITYLEISDELDPLKISVRQMNQSTRSPVVGSRVGSVSKPKNGPPLNAGKLAAYYSTINGIAESMDTRFGEWAAGLLLNGDYALSNADAKFLSGLNITYSVDGTNHGFVFGSDGVYIRAAVKTLALSVAHRHVQREREGARELMSASRPRHLGSFGVAGLERAYLEEHKETMRRRVDEFRRIRLHAPAVGSDAPSFWPAAIALLATCGFLWRARAALTRRGEHGLRTAAFAPTKPCAWPYLMSTLTVVAVVVRNWAVHT